MPQERIYAHFGLDDEKFVLDPEECGSWDVISDNDLWEAETNGSGQEDYVLVRQEDIVDGIACFMAAYLLSLKQTKVG